MLSFVYSLVGLLLNSGFLKQLRFSSFSATTWTFSSNSPTGRSSSIPIEPTTKYQHAYSISHPLPSSQTAICANLRHILGYSAFKMAFKFEKIQIFMIWDPFMLLMAGFYGLFCLDFYSKISLLFNLLFWYALF